MRLHSIEAVATTLSVDPGEETQDAEGVHIRHRVFTDRVESEHAALDGTNRVEIDLDAKPDGTGNLSGSFKLDSTDGRGSWVGMLQGHLDNGRVVAAGLARGQGEFADDVLSIDYRQLAEHPGTPPSETCLAFFRMNVTLLTDKR